MKTCHVNSWTQASKKSVEWESSAELVSQIHAKCQERWSTQRHDTPACLELRKKFLMTQEVYGPCRGGRQTCCSLWRL